MRMQLIKETLALPDTFGITAAAEQQRNDLAERGRDVLNVTTTAEQNSAVEIARDLRTFIKRVRADGLDLRRPLTAAASKIKAVEDEYLVPLEAEQARLEKLVTCHQAAEARRVAEEQAKRDAETARLEAERAAAEAAARIAESSMTTEAQLVAALGLEKAAEAAVEEWQRMVAAPLPEIHKAKGASTRRVMKIEVTDLHALYAARPELVRLEANFSAIRSTCFPEMPVPGLKLWWENETSVRAW